MDNTIIEKGSFLAVRSPRNSFYLCRITSRIHFDSVNYININWLEKSKDKNQYILGKEDKIPVASVICEIKLQKISRFRYNLTDNAKEFIMKEIKYILEQEEKERSLSSSLEHSEISGEKTVDNLENENHAIHCAKTKHSDLLNENDDCDANFGAKGSFSEGILNKISLAASSESQFMDCNRPETFKDFGDLTNQNDNSTNDDNMKIKSILIQNDTIAADSNRVNINFYNEGKFCNELDAEIFKRDQQVYTTECLTKDKTCDKIVILQDIPLTKQQNSTNSTESSLSERNNSYEDSNSEYIPSEESGSNYSETNIFENCIEENKIKPVDKINISDMTEKVKVKLSTSTSDFLSSTPEINLSMFKSYNNNEKVKPVDKKVGFDIIKTENYLGSSSTFNFTSTVPQVKLTFSTFSHNRKRLFDKRHSCFVCHKKCLKMARHLELKHKNEIPVSKLLALQKNSLERRRGFLELIRIGDFYHNMETLSSKNGELILCRRPHSFYKEQYSYNNFGPCPYCLGFMAKSFLYRHVKTCITKKADTPTLKKTVNSASNALVNSMLFTGSVNFRKEILDQFKNDKISAICKTDNLIIGVGLLLFEKHGNTQSHLIRQTMRQLARLLDVIQENTPDLKDKNLTYFVSPTHFDVIINGVKTLCQVQDKFLEKTEYGIPSLALKIGHSLRKCVAFLRGQALRCGLLDKDGLYRSFLELLDMEWEIRISSNALYTLSKRKMNSALLLPLTSDLLKLNKFISIEMDVFKVLLINNPTETTAWLRLAEATLSRVVLFNKRRGGEMSQMTLSQYSESPEWTKESTEELQNSLSQSEKELAKQLKLVQIRGKRGRIVSALLTEEMISAINVLISTRFSVGVNPCNPFVFARPFKESTYSIRGPDALRTIVAKANLESPQTVTSTKLRKYTATVCQVLNLQEREVDWLARHLGHDIRVHRDFYRLHESAVELTKVSRLLMTIDSGEVSKFKGKSLEDIQLNDLPDIQESDPEDWDEELTEQINTIPTTTNSYNKKANESCEERKANNRRKPKKPWNQEESEAVLTFFRTEIKHKIVPGKTKCLECISQAGKALKDRNWRDVKYYVKNYITKINKHKKCS